MTGLTAGAFYWARSDKHTDGRPTVVRVSTVFGEEPDFWTVAVTGSDQHYMIGDFEIIAEVEQPDGYSVRLAAE